MLADAKYREHVARVVSLAPPLSEEQRARLALLLRDALAVDPNRPVGIYPPMPTAPRGAV